MWTLGHRWLVLHGTHFVITSAAARWRPVAEPRGNLVLTQGGCFSCLLTLILSSGKVSVICSND